MSLFTKAVPTLALAVLLAGCEGDDGLDGRDGVDGTDGSNGFNSLVRTRTLPRGDANCPGGGRVLESGLDTNRNNVLDNSEVTGSEFLDCATAPRLRALHASADAPAVNIIVNGGQALAGVDYRQGSGFLAVAETTRVQVEGIIPGGNAIVIDETLSLEFSRDYTVIAAGPVAGIGALVFSNPTDSPITPGSLRAQVVHAASTAPAVDVYITTPGANLAASAPISSGLSFTEASGRVEAVAGDYQIRVTLAGDPTTVVYDTGTVSLPAGADLLAVAVENVGPGTTPIQVVLMDGTGAADLLDKATPASVVAVHASPDAPAVDLLADDASTPATESIVLGAGLPFTAFCEIAAVPAPGSYNLSVTATGDPSTVALQFPLSVSKGDELTAIVTGFLSSGTPAIQPLPLLNDRRSVATEAKLRITHGSPSTPAVDIYLVADGTDLLDPTTTPAFSAVPFGANTGILSIGVGTYDVYVTPAGNKGVVAIEVQDAAFTGGEVLDVIARDPQTDGGEGPLPQLILIDYSALGACPTGLGTPFPF